MRKYYMGIALWLGVIGTSLVFLSIFGIVAMPVGWTGLGIGILGGGIGLFGSSRHRHRSSRSGRSGRSHRRRRHRHRH